MLEKLFHIYSTPLYNHLLGKTGDPELSEDLVQETYLRAADKPDLDSVRNLPSYLFRIANNLLIDHHRRQTVRKTDADTDRLDTCHDESGGPEMQVGTVITLERIKASLATMPKLTQDVFILCRVTGKTHKEAARYLRISTSSVQKHLASALNRISQHNETGNNR